MASWCWICHSKVKADYVYYQGGKCHPGCRKMKREQLLAKRKKDESRKSQVEEIPPTN